LSDRFAEFDDAVKERKKPVSKPTPLTRFGFEAPEEHLLSVDATIRGSSEPKKRSVPKERPANQLVPENTEL